MGAVGSVDDMISVSAGEGYGLCGAGSVENVSGVGGKGCSE
jgi:hypothetical protein|tara:strand:- start:25869 stop:25991 length:123 start_codon:yes stop_codon:yes gene_type:complete